MSMFLLFTGLVVDVVGLVLLLLLVLLVLLLLMRMMVVVLPDPSRISSSKAMKALMNTDSLMNNMERSAKS